MQRLCNGQVSFRPSVCLSRRSTAAVTCGWFAAELGRVQHISIDSCWRHVLAVGRYMLPELRLRVASRSEPRFEALNTDLLTGHHFCVPLELPNRCNHLAACLRWPYPAAVPHWAQGGAHAQES